jgi:hypothetical protein
MSPTEKSKKISISVPEALLVRAQAEHPNMSTSGVITLALEAKLRDHHAVAYSFERPAEAAERFAEVKAELAEKARAEFESGYLHGIEAASEISWYHVEDLDYHDYDVTRWVQPILNGAMDADLDPDSSAQPSAAFGSLVEHLGSLMSPYGENMFWPSKPYLRGFAQAIRDLYVEVSEGILTEPPMVPGPADFADSNGTGSEEDAPDQ